jgi:hypothetical protein
MTATRVSRSLAEQPDAVQTLVKLVDRQAAAHGLVAVNTETGRAYRFPPNTSAVGVYWGSGRGVEFNIDRFRTFGQDDAADGLLHRFSTFLGRPVTATKWPAIPLDDAAARPNEVIDTCIGPYLTAAEALADPSPPPPGVT